MMCVFGTPTELSACTTSRTSAIDVVVCGTPDGFTLMATMSAGVNSRAQALLASA